MIQTVLPAEWAPQSAVMITWPHDAGDWKPWLAEADATYVRLAEEISRRQDLLVVYRDDEHRAHIRRLLKASAAVLNHIRMYPAPSNDTWARDHGPITVYRGGQPVLLDFRFNGWGGKFPADLDNTVTRSLHQANAFGITPLVSEDLILEGGGIESDGQGTLLTTRACLLNANRNGLDQAQMEARLEKLLGVKRFLWLSRGALAGDDTDSHIDTLARFCDPMTIAYQGCGDPNDEHYAPLAAMADELQRFRTPAGTPYRLVSLPLPRPVYDNDGKRLPAGYANFLILNDAVLVPTYNDPADNPALERLREVFTDRSVVGVPCSTLIRQYGSLHCVTMQLPLGACPVSS